ncbi:peptidyl-prolyl cis-trans isomerase [Christensenellaceae bacterium OttesenSCG-928-M15]|nr:peptidyl-prolyl cis-trans isomerase [Christensenellaceae bacterium OttesenSCG-928-M15]
MNNKWKKALTVFCALALCVSMVGCNLATVNEERDEAQIVAKVGDFEVTKGEVAEEFLYYVNLYSQYGIAMAEEDIVGLREEIMEYRINQKVLEIKAKELGFAELNEEDKAAMEEAIQADIDGALEYVQEMVDMEKEGAPDLDEQALLEQYHLEYVGYSIEDYAKTVREYYEASYPTTKLREDNDAKVTVSEEEVRAEYDEMLAADKESYDEDPGSYKFDREDYEAYYSETGLPPLYAPEGYRRVRVIAIYPEAELGTDYTDKITRMEELKVELGNLSLKDAPEEGDRTEEEIRSEYDTLKAETDQMSAAHIAPGKTGIEAAYEKLQGGADFSSVLAEYTQLDEFNTVDTFKEKGMLMSVHESTEDWPQAVKDAAMKLAKGAYTEVIADEDAFYIVQYTQDEPTGEVAYETVYDMIKEQALSEKRETEWAVLVEAWSADTSLVTRYPDVLKTITAE